MRWEGGRVLADKEGHLTTHYTQNVTEGGVRRCQKYHQREVVGVRYSLETVAVPLVELVMFAVVVV